MSRLVTAKQEFPGLAGANTIFRNRIRHLNPLTAVPFPTFRLTASVVMFVHHGRTSAASQQPHIVGVRTASHTRVLPQSTTQSVIQVKWTY
jgi:hypothetical protein